MTTHVRSHAAAATAISAPAAFRWALDRLIAEAAPNACFEAARRPVGFTVLELRRTFLARGSVLAWARKA